MVLNAKRAPRTPRRTARIESGSVIILTPLVVISDTFFYQPFISLCPLIDIKICSFFDSGGRLASGAKHFAFFVDTSWKFIRSIGVVCL